jgi:hypothetical protein
VAISETTTITVPPTLRERLEPALRDGRPADFKEIPTLEQAQAMFDAAQAWYDMHGELMELIGGFRATAQFHHGRGYEDSMSIARAFERLARQLERRQ